MALQPQNRVVIFQADELNVAAVALHVGAHFFQRTQEAVLQ